jgi:hypothetical protein
MPHLNGKEENLMRYAVISIALFLVLCGQALATGVSEPTMTIDEYSAHRHVRYIHDLALCMDRLMRDLSLDAKEAYLIDGNRGLAYGYTDAFFNDVVHYAPQHNDHWKNLDVMQRQLNDIFDLRAKIIEECDLLLNNSTPGFSVADSQAFNCEWLLSPTEDALVQSIRDNAFQIDNHWLPNGTTEYYLDWTNGELGQAYSFCDFPAIESWMADARVILGYVIADINTLSLARNINCDW